MRMNHRSTFEDRASGGVIQRGFSDIRPSSPIVAPSGARFIHHIYDTVTDTDRANEIFPAENEDEDTEATVARSVFVFTSSSTLVSDCLIKYISIVCCFVVAMPSGKRETERKVNAPVDTGPSPNSDERVNNPTEGADEPARERDSLHLFYELGGR
ncbi:hypothetical protein T08_6616 [Trichinella sp. T8]|nr:hypothetical protein T08_6616 [Trichinella sp. T8]